MEIGIVGLGEMGSSMARRLARRGVRVVGFDVDDATRLPLQHEGVIEPADCVRAMAARLSPPRVVWLMVAAGTATELMIQDVWPELARGDVIVDGGNARYKDSQRRAAALASAGIHFVDCGVCGGLEGLEDGYRLTYGATPAALPMILPYMKILAPAEDRGHLYCGGPGAGHFVKMIHNGIEHAMMQAHVEGFALLENKHDLSLDVAAVAQTWRQGSAIRSLFDLAAECPDDDATLPVIAPGIADSGEGRWMIQEAAEQGVPAPVLSVASMAGFASRGRGESATRMLAMMRKSLDGHPAKRSDGASA